MSYLNKKTVALFDGDSIIFPVGFACEKTLYRLVKCAPGTGKAVRGGPSRQFEYKKDLDAYLNRVTVPFPYKLQKRKDLQPLENALHSVKVVINKCLEALGTKDYEIYYGGTDNFRHEVATIQVYKGNRDPNYRPTHEAKIKEYLSKVWDAKEPEGMEADDMVAIRQYELRKQGINSVIIGVDKDLRTIPGNHYNWKKPDEGVVFVSPKEALYAFYLQVLSGDAADNIRGIPGMGEKKAVKWYDTYDIPDDCDYKRYRTMLHQAALDRYIKYHEDSLEAMGMSGQIQDKTVRQKAEEEMLENGRLLWIKRNRDPELWEFPE